MDNAYPEGLHNIIVDVFDVVLKYGNLLPPYTLSQLKPSLFLKVGAMFRSSDSFPAVSWPLTFDQVHNFSTITLLFTPRVHWYQANPLANYLHSKRTCKKICGGPLRMRLMHLIVRSISNFDIIYRCSNTATVSSRISFTTMGPSWSSVSIELLSTVRQSTSDGSNNCNIVIIQ